MNTRLPPLRAVRVFEAAGRHLSFNRAADELNITPSAVSHQVKTLEEALGVPLFKRQNRQVSLTEAGRRYLPPLSAALEQIAAATERVVADGSQDTLKMTLVPAFAVRWLIPRLSGFQSAYPEIEVLLTTSMKLMDLVHSDFDLGVRFGAGNWPDLVAHELISEELFPVCAPSLLEGDQPLERPADLVHHTLLHVIPRADTWTLWLTAAGVQGVDTSRGPRFANGAVALEAAVGGLGVAMADRSLVAADLESGRLVAPFDVEISSNSHYYLVYARERAHEGKIAAFRDWILSEVSNVPSGPALDPSRLTQHPLD